MTMAMEDYMIPDSQGGRRTKAAQEQSALEYKQDLANKERIKYDLAAEAFHNEYETIKSFGSKFFTLRDASKPGLYDKVSDKDFNADLRHFLTNSTELPVCLKTKAEVADAIADIYNTFTSSTDYLALTMVNTTKLVARLKPALKTTFISTPLTMILTLKQKTGLLLTPS